MDSDSAGEGYGFCSLPSSACASGTLGLTLANAFTPSDFVNPLVLEVPRPPQK